MSQVAPMFKWVSVVFVVLTAIFAASTGYLLVNPSTLTQTVNQTETQMLTSTVVSSVNSPLYSVNIAYKPAIGFYLTNATGWTLYLLKTDVPANGTSTCSGKCIENWPAFYVETENLNLPQGLMASSFAEITRPDGSKQVTYNGWPLYYFINDKQPGDTNGQGIKGVWFAYSLSTPSQTTTDTTTSGGMGGGGSGYSMQSVAMRSSKLTPSFLCMPKIQ